METIVQTLLIQDKTDQTQWWLLFWSFLRKPEEWGRPGYPNVSIRKKENWAFWGNLWYWWESSAPPPVVLSLCCSLLFKFMNISMSMDVSKTFPHLQLKPFPLLISLLTPSFTWLICSQPHMKTHLSETSLQKRALSCQLFLIF